MIEALESRHKPVYGGIVEMLFKIYIYIKVYLFHFVLACQACVAEVATSRQVHLELRQPIKPDADVVGS